MSLPDTPGDEVVITDDFDEGIACFKIVTEGATYFYDKAGAGFTRPLDRDGIDWINFRPEGTPGVAHGQWGWFQGIPQMVQGVFGHPGYTGASSTTADAKGVPLSAVTVGSGKDDWEVSWKFYPSCARMTVVQAPARYSLGYEGTPGGELSGDDLCGRSDGRVSSCSIAWQEDVVNTSGVATDTEWVYFADARLERSLVLLHDDDDVTDCYRPMDGMTVFGFGRADRPRATSFLRHVVDGVAGRLGLIKRSVALLERVPASLIIGFVEARDFEEVKAGIGAIYRIATGPGARSAGQEIARSGVGSPPSGPEKGLTL